MFISVILCLIMLDHDDHTQVKPRDQSDQAGEITLRAHSTQKSIGG